MTKVSSNAGKHPYLRSDNVSLFHDIKQQKKGLRFDPDNQPKARSRVSTEYFDQNNLEIFGGDTVIYKNEEYRIDYSSREFSWIMEKVNDPKRYEILRKTAHLTILKQNSN